MGDSPLDGEVAAVAADEQQVVRHGPGVPAAREANRGVPTAEQVWRTAPRQPRRLLQRAGLALSVVLLGASGAVMYQRLHHGPFGVTGVVIASQVDKGCTQDVTGLISTTGSAGTVSYQWVFTPQAGTPRALRQPVASGQSALYVTAVVEGQGHGSSTQTVTLRVLGPEAGSASAKVVLRC